ncbi:peptidase [Streptomyces sp. J2-1]|uniref:Clp protease N-terminal domain-containing protein n=1 Tax=Streptomyces corallincola TaxID=2851888 RepID=UPI001C38B6B2|nr:Clp protease N-terminal domain-containing protein [Streptomyces corallincola]MBV2353220.1 peptidase [Streptomyces corallincola]
MFERFTRDARYVVRGAVEHAEREGTRSITAEHLLLALLDRRASRASFALGALGVRGREDSVREALAHSRRRAGLSRAEADALAGLGIDITEIVSRVEETHGTGALSGEKRSTTGWSGRRPFDPSAKETLQGALRTAVLHQDRHIGDEHLLLALTVRPGVPAEVLADHGVTHESLLRVLYGEGSAQAG